MFRNDKDLSSPCWVSSLNQWPRHLLGLLVSRKIQVLYNILLGYSQVLRDCEFLCDKFGICERVQSVRISEL